MEPVITSSPNTDAGPGYRQSVADAIERIKATHGRLNAAAEILEKEALEQLNHLPDGPLKGMPISVKECYAMAGKQITSGSKRMKPIACGEDATVVRKLKEAGAVIVSRGNTSEFLLGRETDNLVFGNTNNALFPGLTAGGSSGGEGSLVGSGCVDVGIGTDIGGSCRYPAAFNGIIGFKPASGQIDKTGVFPSAGNDFVESMNSPGILSRTVADVRKVYNVIGDKQLVESNNIGDARILTSSGFQVRIKDAVITESLNASIRFFSERGLKTENVDIPDSGSHYKDFALLMTGAFTDKIYEWSVTADGEKLSFLSELSRRIMGRPTLSHELFAVLLPYHLIKPSAARMKKIIQKVEQARAAYQAMLGNNGVLLLPTLGILAPPHRKFIPQYNKPGVIEIITPVSFCNIYNLSCITLPAWKFQHDKTKSPPAVQLAVAPGNEELLLNVAAQLEVFLK